MILALGGLVGRSSSDQALLGSPAHDAATPFNGAIGLFGDGRAASAAVLELTPEVDRLGEPS